VKDKSGEVLDNVKNLEKAYDEKVTSNTEYALNFANVMSNAHNGGSDNKAVVNFLSSPLVLNGRVGETIKMSVVPHFMTIILVMLILGISYALKSLDLRRKMKDKDTFATPSRAWLNVPALTKIIGVGVAISVVFSIITIIAIKPTKVMMLCIYISLIAMSGIVIITAILRAIPKVSVFIIGGLLGIYLLLTPLIGTDIQPHSMTEMLFRVSPIQNIEEGLGAVMSGGRLGWQSYLIIIGLMALGVVANLLIKNSVREK
jgi:hypothetical protein